MDDRVGIKLLNYDSSNLEQVKLVKDLLLYEYVLDIKGNKRMKFKKC